MEVVSGYGQVSQAHAKRDCTERWLGEEIPETSESVPFNRPSVAQNLGGQLVFRIETSRLTGLTASARTFGYET